MGKVTDAAADYEFLLKHKGLNHYDRQRSLGRAWFYLAFCRCTPAVESAKKSRSDTAPYRSVSMEDIGRAIEIMEGSLQCALPNDGFAQIELGLAYLAQGELGKGQSLIEEGVCAERHFREMDELLRFEMPWFETAIRSLPHRTALKRLLNKPSAGIKNQIKKRLAEISSVHLDAASELNDVLAHFGSESNSTWLAVAIRAALARLTTETAPEAAIAMYKSLQKNEPEGFELAKTALKRLALEALAKGDELAATNAPGAAWFYRQANRAQPNCEAEAALAGLAVMDSDGTHEDALSHLQAAIELWEREESAAGAFGRRIAAITPDIATAWRTQKCLKAIEARYLAVESTTETVRACQEALFRQMDFWIGAVSTQDRFALIPPAIRLEIGRAMIPGDTSQEGWVLRSTYLPEMRERIESTLGIDVPSVNIIAGYSADAYAYSVELWGIARHGFGGSVPAEFQPDSLKYVTQKLEAAIREYGYEFLGVDDAWEVAQKWIDRPRAKGILDARVATTSERVHFSRLLRALVRDGVPLLPPDAILEALDTIPLTPVSLPRIVAMIRQQMKEKLPGNEAGAPRIDLAPHWERSLVDWERRPQTALEAENIHKMIDEVRSEAEEALAEADYALVTLRVKNAGVAQLVRRLLRHELPGVRVLAQEEVI